ncbi:hypothetical protein RISK_005711 [Rhodopirellula islandica]|uniref:Uncharacterized protein n=1 Tax=Rhodopirellula islandica TaxID=595434 RepID=A0A0J1B747_RHOIS|nr:hypothetical protein RISK_005711 [Rhodopirellula islandica]
MVGIFRAATIFTSGSLTDPGLARHHGEETYLRIPFACQLG